MTSVLIDSVKIGISGWSSVRRCQRVKVSGMQMGDCITILFNDPGLSKVHVIEDCEVKIPEGVTRVRAAHTSCGGGRIFVDLI